MKYVAKVAIGLLATAAMLPLAACSSEGTNRVASVGTAPGDAGTGSGGGDSGSGSGGGGTTDSGSGDTGTGAGTTGTGTGVAGTGTGTGTGAGSTGTGTGTTGTGTGTTGTGTGSAGTGTGTGSTGTIAGQSLSNVPVPGLIGNNGVADTGLLANTGNPNNPGVLGPVLVTAGNAVLGATGQTPTLVSAVDGTVPGSVPIAGTIQKVLTDTGQALVDTGTGKAYLVDGLTGAVGDAVSLNVLGKNAVPGNSGTLVGASIASPTQNAGTLATVGVDAAGNLLRATATPLGAGNAAVVNAVLPNGTSGSALAGTTSALGNVAAVTAGTTNVLGGGAGTTPAVGVSVLSPTQNAGTVATVGVGSAGQTLTAAVAPVSAVGSTAGNAVNSAVTQVKSAVTPVTTTVASAVSPVTSALPANGIATVTAGNTAVLNGGATPAIGASVLSPTQATGSALTAGAASAGNVVTATLKGATGALGGTTTTTTTTNTPARSILGKVL